jgi:hypothetical protein
LGVEKTVVEDIEFDEDEQLLVAHVRTPQACTRSVWAMPATLTGLRRRRGTA